MLESGRIQLVPPQELGLSGCDMCGAMYQEGREFVGFDNRSAESSDVAPGSIHTIDDGASAVAYRTRNHSGSGTATITVRKPVVCSDCLKGAAELLGYGDRSPLLAESEELRRQHGDLRERFEQSEEQRIEAEAKVRDSEFYSRLLAAGEPNGSGPKQRPQPKSRKGG